MTGAKGGTPRFFVESLLFTPEILPGENTGQAAFNGCEYRF